MFRRIWDTILAGWEVIKEAIMGDDNPLGARIRKDLKGIVKEGIKLIPATLIGIFAAYHFPLFLSAIASIPIMKWVVDRWNLPPTARVALQLAVVFLLDILFAYFPFITLVLGIIAVYMDTDLVINKIVSAYTKIEEGLSKAIDDEETGVNNASPTPAPC